MPDASEIVRPGAAQELRGRLDQLRSKAAYMNYERSRDAVLRMMESNPKGAAHAPSEYWQEELGNIEYMLDASPLVVDKLRHHSYHVTGVWPYNYRLHKDRERSRHESKLNALLDIGRRDLLVPESPLLGGFGFEIDGALYNVDTLKFFEVLIALDKAAVLDEVLTNSERPIVWEIGAGWGGFAYQLKTLREDMTYVITDLPELFLFSATYLMTAFPDARVAFWNGESESIDWNAADFVFVPNFALDAVRPPRIDLTVNMVSFQEMTTEQVDGYIRHAFEQGSGFVYSLNRERSLYNPDLDGVGAILDRYYWPHEIDVLPVAYGKFLDDYSDYTGKKAKPAAERLDYKHLVGWKRVLP